MKLSLLLFPLLLTACSVTYAAENDASDFFIACEKGDYQTVKYYVENKLVDINSYNKDGSTALILCIYKQDITIVSYLLKKGADPSKPHIDGINPIFDAVYLKNIDLIEILLSYGADINSKGGYYSGNALFWAITFYSCYNESEVCDKDYYKIIKYLVDKGIDLNVRSTDFENTTLLHHVIAFADLKVLDLLVDKIDINVLNDWGVTPLTLAIDSGKMEMVTYLLGKNPDLNKGKWTPLMYAAGFGTRNFELVKILIEKGADPFIKDPDGYTAYDYACGDIEALCDKEIAAYLKSVMEEKR